MRRLHRLALLLVTALACGAVGIDLVHAAATASQTALLGSPDWQPSPEHPTGWRGDWSGRYPGATPPTEWARWAKTSIHDLRCQAAKPGGEDGASGDSLEFGRVEDWLVSGPFSVEDADKALDHEFIGAEADLRPDAGEKAADNSWVAFKAGGDNQHGGAGQSGVEFYRALQSKPGLVCGYAHTYVYAPAAVKVSLQMGMPAPMKIWINGKVADQESKTPYAGRKSLVLDLNKGWNSLLCKEISEIKGGDDGRKAWRFTATLAPLEKSFDYETKNVVWMTPLPAASTALPVIVGDKLFVMSQYSDLLCINKSDGKILWMHGNDLYSAMSDAEKAAFPDLKAQLDPEEAKLDALDEQMVQELNSRISATGLSDEQARALREKLAAKGRQEIKINELLVKDKVAKRVPHIQHVGTANGTPCSDGTHVWAMFGGGIYDGPFTVVCYDLAGKRIWSRAYSDVDAGEHGTHCSPIIADGKLVVQTLAMLRVLDAQTGKDIWEAKAQGFGNNGGGSPICTKIGGDTVIVGPRRDIWRLSDGKMLYSSPAQQLGNSLQTPVIDRGVLYDITGWGTSSYTGTQMPEIMADKLEPKLLYQVRVDPAGKYKSYEFVNSFVGSPLYDNGLVYYLTQGGILQVSDAVTGNPVYVRMLDEMRTRVQWVFWNGACGSPVLGGKYIYLTDDNGITVVIEPGREYKRVAVNALENFGEGFSQEQTLGMPIFEGKFMYYRTPNYLYCIGGK